MTTKEYDSALYDAFYFSHENNDYKKLWQEILSKSEILSVAIELTTNKWGEPSLKGLFIAHFILSDYGNELVDKDVYNKLQEIVFSVKEIARTCYSLGCNGGSYRFDSFLVMGLYNPHFLLTNEQKEFILKELVINCDINLLYFVLKNSNWSFGEKQRIINEKFEEDDDFDEFIYDLKKDIINCNENFVGCFAVIEDIYDMNLYTLEQLIKLYKNRQVAEYIYGEIHFCKYLQDLRYLERTMDNPESNI